MESETMEKDTAINLLDQLCGKLAFVVVDSIPQWEPDRVFVRIVGVLRKDDGQYSVNDHANNLKFEPEMVTSIEHGGHNVSVIHLSL